MTTLSPETGLSPEKGLSPDQIAVRVETILREATLEEKVAMMSGLGFFEQFKATGRTWGADPYRAGSGCERLGVPPLFFTDGPRGVARGRSTCFPVLMARGATFDPDLERRIGEQMSIEIRAQGCTLSGAVCVNLLRHPAWGRAQETYGEDPHHLGEMGAALAEGLQTHNVIATVKHFALNSMENARFKVDVSCDPRALREVYLPHFKRILDAGCASVMSAYNKLNGEYCGQSRALLTDILRGDWGFDGFVHSDWVFGVRSVFGAAAGLDIENPEPIVFGKNLLKAAQDGAVGIETIETACRRILSTQYRFACAQDPLPAYTEEMVASPAARALALEAAEKAAVLLENRGVLPFAPEQVKTLAVLGRLARIENTGDFGSSRVRARHVVTPLEGLRALLGEDAVIAAEETDLAAARAACAAADAVVVVVGNTADEEGEFIPGDIALGQDANEAARDASDRQATMMHNRSRGGDRTSLGLPADQVALIAAAAEAGKPIAVVIVAGSAVLTEGWRERAGAILQTFYNGQEGGTALARLLFGAVSPSGKLPFTVAREAAHYPFFDKDADAITYDLWHGYTKLEREGVAPRYAFGHGLSYARFAYRALKARRAGDHIQVSVAITNEGAVAAEEVGFFFVAPPGKAVERPAKLLKAFGRVRLAPGETQVLRRAIPLADLGWWNEAAHAFTLEPGAHRILAGGSSAGPLLEAVVSL
jgi:beta-glucosidase